MKIIIQRKKKINWTKRIGLTVFYLQFLAALFFFIKELQTSCSLLGGDICSGNIDLIFLHYFKLMILIPIVGLSFLFTMLGVILKWDFKFEQEILTVFIFVIWLIFILTTVIVNQYYVF